MPTYREPLPCGRIRANLSAVAYVRGQSDVAVAGAPTAYLDLDYSLNDGGTWSDELMARSPPQWPEGSEVVRPP